MMNGIILINKPLGWTSFDAVNKVRRTIEASGLNTTNRKRFPVGHTGTLDPLAEGLLVVLLGDYTRRAPDLVKVSKTYEVMMTLGQTSSTGDEEGEKQSVSDLQPKLFDIEKVFMSFVGDSMQTPPQYSAIKVNGQRAYKLAREGKKVDLEPRPIHVARMLLLSYHYPDVHFLVEVSSGTYVRALIEDMGKVLTTGAYMKALKRSKVGNYDIRDAISPENITAELIQENLRSL